MTTPGFANPISAGGILVQPRIQSPNFSIAGQTGWAILANGLAYFFDIVLSGGTITGPDWILNSAGYFQYSGTPAHGNLILSLASAAGTDGFSNAYPEGLGVSQGTIPGTLITAGSIPASAVGFTATSIGGITTYVQGTAPTGSINAGSLWIDTASGNALYQYTSGSWSLYQFGSGSIQANSISAAQIAANTITASQLAAGIIYAGIVNGTLIEGATIVADSSTGGFFGYANTLPSAQTTPVAVAYGNFASSGTTYTASVTTATTGTGIVVGVSSISETVTGVTDTAGNTYTLIASNTSQTYYTYVYYCKNPVELTTSSTITATLAAASATNIYAVNVPTGWTLDVKVSASSSAGALSLSTGTLNYQNEVCLAFLHNSTNSPTWSGAFTSLGNIQGGNGAGFLSAAYYLPGASTSAATASATFGTTEYSAAVVSLTLYADLTFSAAPASGTDAYGNAYNAGVEIQNGGQILTQGTGAAIREYIDAGNPLKQWLSGYADESGPAGIFTNLFNIGDPDEYITWWIFGPTVTGQKDAAFVQLNSSEQNAGNNAYGALGYQDTSGNQVIGLLNWGPGGINGMGTLSAVEPGTGTVAVDAVAETWHNITMVNAEWTAATPTPAYRMLPSGEVQLKGAFIYTSAGTALSGNNQFASALPAAYRPASLQYLPALLIGGTATPTITANRTPAITVATSGILSIVNVSSAATSGDTVDLSFAGDVSYQLAN